ncbi:MAG: sugar ABC transporter ATP-binding protein [Anaerolineales bacterium]|nr:sugar ABC transporter ATP-binding protein [Anaerolineales bacterium]
MSKSSEYLLELQGISKTFPGAHALRNINFNVQHGETHVLLGENGAGKSTLVKILTGVYQPDRGTILFEGKPVTFKDPRDSQNFGVSAIYQERNLVHHLSIAENIYLGKEPHKFPGLPIIDRKRMIDGAQALLDRLNLPLDPTMAVGELNAVEQQLVEVARALRMETNLIIMDEPTASMSTREVSDLFSVIRALHAQGVAVIYISHRLEEVPQIGQRATILRNGSRIATVTLADTSLDQLIRLIVGRILPEKFPEKPYNPGAELLRVEGLCRDNEIEDISFSLHEGEIMGISGLVGAGGTALTRAIFGADPANIGTIFLDGKPIHIATPQDAISHGIGLLTDDRLEQGLVLEMLAQDNVTLAALESAWPGPLIDHRLENNLATHYAERLGIKAEHLRQQTSSLSGGTQQKIVLSKWLATQARVLVFDEPTRGIDIGARVEIYNLINDLAQNGNGIIITSVDLNEILGMCDRILVMRNGRIVADIPRIKASKQILLAYASGGTPV